MKNGRDMLLDIAEILGDKATLDAIIVAMSTFEAKEMAEWIDRMHDLNLFDPEEEDL